MNECTKENGGCSHTCTNLQGGHVCSCPGGWDLAPDSRSCVLQKKKMCPAMPRPKFGFYRCTRRKTSEGYEVGTKCQMKCRKGFKVVSQSRKKCTDSLTWVGDEGECQRPSCPLLTTPPNVVVSPSSCSTGSSSVRSRCFFSCTSGYQLQGSSYAKCGDKETWKYVSKNPPSCKSNFPPPFIMCPPDQTKPLPQGSSSVYVMFPQPKTNIDWFRYVESSPKWAKQLEGEMKLGRHVLNFRARSPFSNQTASCQMVIHVKDTEPPRVESCPQSFVDHLRPGQKMKRVTWKEPVFKDNVGIQHVMASFLPGHYFTKGRHHVLYQASDSDGNRARCGFTITIKAGIPNLQYYPTKRPTQYSKNSVLPSPIAVPRSRSRSGMSSQCQDVPEVPNGRMACINRRDSKKCTPVCNVGHVFYQKFSYRPPTYLCSSRRIDWKINRFIPDCSPVEKTKTPGMCPPGWEARDRTCIGCPPGMYRDRLDLCQLCPKGSFSDKFGSHECTKCSQRKHTSSLGSKKSSDCKEGYYRKPKRARIAVGC